MSAPTVPASAIDLGCPGFVKPPPLPHEAVMRDRGTSFQALADEAFADVLKKHKQPVGLKASLKESVTANPKRKRG